MKTAEILEELQSIGSGKTLDALLPPLLFALINHYAGLRMAVFLALGLAAVLGASRLIRRQPWQYALGGFLTVGLASSLAWLTRSATGYFIPAIATSAALFSLAFVSLLVGRPMAAWASHLARGWPLEWFWRNDIRPAYREVTIIWAMFFLLRLVIQFVLFRGGDVTGLAWAGLLLGWPVTILVLVISYIYGIRRLHVLRGPGVEEFRNNRMPPWKGQTRGF